MSDMIELVAMALCKADDSGNVVAIFASKEHRGDCTHQAFTCALCEADHYRNLARTAVETMREPTSEMVNAAMHSSHQAQIKPETSIYNMFVADYRAMIDAALAKPIKTP